MGLIARDQPMLVFRAKKGTERNAIKLSVNPNAICTYSRF